MKYFWFAERLREIIDIKYGSISNAGKILGVTSDTIRNSYLNGKSLPGFNFLSSLAKDNVDIYFLLTGSKFVTKSDATDELYFRINSLIDFLINEFPDYLEVDEDEISIEALVKKLILKHNRKESFSIGDIANLSLVTPYSLYYILTGINPSELNLNFPKSFIDDDLEFLNDSKEFPDYLEHFKKIIKLKKKEMQYFKELSNNSIKINKKKE